MRLVEALKSEIETNRVQIIDVETKFCKQCGSEFTNEISICYVCGDTDFLSGKIAAEIHKYYHMTPKDLRQYYRKRAKKSSVRMNVRQVALYLLIKDGFVDTKNLDELKKMELVIQRIWWKRL